MTILWLVFANVRVYWCNNKILIHGLFISPQHIYESPQTEIFNLVFRSIRIYVTVNLVFMPLSP